MTWTIESELLAMSGCSDLQHALTQMDLVSYGEEGSITSSNRWIAAGTETYTLELTVSSESGSRDYIFKACVALGPESPVGKIVDLWLERRQALASMGVETPRLCGVHSATILEEYIPYSFWDVLRGGRLDLVSDLAYVARVMDELGFNPVGVADFRSRGDDLVVIDFGEDLGHMSGVPSGELAPLEVFTRQLEISLRGTMDPGLPGLFREMYRQVAL